MDAYTLNLPPSYKGKRLKIYFASQVATCPPTFNPDDDVLEFDPEK